MTGVATTPTYGKTPKKKRKRETKQGGRSISMREKIKDKRKMGREKKEGEYEGGKKNRKEEKR